MRSLGGCRVFKAVVDRVGVSGKDWTGFLGVVADGQDVIKSLTVELIHALGAMPGNVDAQLPHGGNGFGPDAARFRSGTEYLKAVSCVAPQQTFGHLAPRRVSGAENEDPLLTSHRRQRSQSEGQPPGP